MGANNKPMTSQAKHDPGGQRISTIMVQNVLLVWLDANINESSADFQNTMTHLRKVMNNINTFTNGDQCFQFLDGLRDEKVCMVTSGSLGKHLVPCVHDMSQVDSIFIFCGNKQYHEQWTRNWPKVKGVYTDIELICDALKQSARDCEQNAIGFSLVATDSDSSNMNLDRLDPMFMYTQILKEILLMINFERKHILDFTQYCRKILIGDENQLNEIEMLERNYHSKSPIWWYTSESFVYPMVNRALRLSDLDIDELHKEHYRGSKADQKFTVYRGQGMTNEEFEKLSKTKGGLIAFNSFLSTSRTESVSISFAKRALRNPELVGVLFEMKIHPKLSTAPFASVTTVGAYGSNEDEILFAIHAVFRIREIQQMGGNTRLFRVKLELTSDNDKGLQELTKRIREETYPNEEGWGRLGLVLRKLGKPKQAEEIYRILLEQEFYESKTGYLYNRLASCKYDQAEYGEAIQLYQKSITIHEKYFPNSPDLAAYYNNIGSVYSMMSEYAKALSSYENALAIHQQLLPSNHPNFAASYNNIGGVYCKMGEYAKALSSHEIALTIRQQSLPPNHPNLASSYINIGSVYYNIGEYAKALFSNEKALAIGQQSLPPNHPDIASSYNNIGLVYCKMGEHAKALSSHEKAFVIRQQSLPPNHPDLAYPYNNIGSVYENMKNYSKAYSFYEKAVKLGEQSLSSNHPELQIWKNNLNTIKKDL